MKIRILLLLITAYQFSFATETQVIIRAQAKDAKFIGSSIGGAYVIVRNSMTDEIMAQGKTAGATGNTSLIMKTPQERGKMISEESTAKFLAVVDIEKPTFVTIEVYGPMNKKQATVTASTQIWLIPGKDILGDGVVLEIPGFVVDVIAPRTHQYLSLATVKNDPIQIQANVVMMCGCPLSEGGTWDSNKVEVTAMIKKDEEEPITVPLQLISQSLFEGDFLVTSTGHYEVTVYAYDESTGNTGVDKLNYVVRD